MAKVSISTQAPEFTSQDIHGNAVSLSNFANKKMYCNTRPHDYSKFDAKQTFMIIGRTTSLSFMISCLIIYLTFLTYETSSRL